MEKKTLMLLILVILELFFTSCQAITCHDCNSVQNSDCGDPFKSSSSTCVGDLCTKGKYEANNVEIVVRGCASSSTHSGTGCESKTYEGQSGTACYCDSDKCNGAVMTSSLGYAIIAAALFINVIVGHMM